MQGLTDRQQQVLSYIRQSIHERGYPPTLREIGAHMGIRSTNGVNDHLRALERKGYLTREDMKSRTLRLVKSSNPPPMNGATPPKLELVTYQDIVEIPILGRIAAGALSEAVHEPEDTVRIDRMLVGGAR